MKVESTFPTLESSKKYQNSRRAKENSSDDDSRVIATGVGVDIRSKNQLNSVIKKNSPDDPIVSKKILDSLDLGFINFSQKERDTLAKIMNKQS